MVEDFEVTVTILDFAPRSVKQIQEAVLDAAYAGSPDRRQVLSEFVRCNVPTELYKAIDR